MASYTRTRNKNNSAQYVDKPYRSTLMTASKRFAAVVISGFSHKYNKNPVLVTIYRYGFDPIKITAPIGSYGIYYERGYKKTGMDNLAWVEKYFLPQAREYVDAQAQAYVENTSNGTLTTKGVVDEQTMTDVVTKGYNKRRKQGELIFSPMDSHKLEISITGNSSTAPANASFTNYEFGSGSNGDGVYYARYEFTAPPTTPLDSLYIQNAIEKALPAPYDINVQDAINNAFGNINVGQLQALVMAGEGRETLRHLAHTFRRFVGIFRALKKGRWSRLAPRTLRKYRRQRGYKKALALLDFFGEAWMEARYAWRPLLIDAHHAIKLLQGKGLLTPRQTFRGYNFYDDSSYQNFFVQNELGQHVQVYGQLVHSTLANAGVLCEATTEIPSLAQVSGLNLADAAWDLIPFSFVVDWFLNIGGLLYNLRPSGSYKVRGQWVTVTDTATFAGSLTVVHGDGTQEVAHFQCNRVSKTRTIGQPETLFSLRLDLDFAKIIDSLVILRNLRR